MCVPLLYIVRMPVRIPKPDNISCVAQQGSNEDLTIQQIYPGVFVNMIWDINSV